VTTSDAVVLVMDRAAKPFCTALHETGRHDRIRGAFGFDVCRSCKTGGGIGQILMDLDDEFMTMVAAERGDQNGGFA
jgi:hypothetical protein